jgi:hypothetical protein
VQVATKDTTAALDRIDQQIVERKFNKVAKGKMEWTTTIKGVAKHNLDVDNWDEALSKLEDMRTVLDELSEVKFKKVCVYKFMFAIGTLLSLACGSKLRGKRGSTNRQARAARNRKKIHKRGARSH